MIPTDISCKSHLILFAMFWKELRGSYVPNSDSVVKSAQGKLKIIDLALPIRQSKLLQSLLKGHGHNGKDLPQRQRGTPENALWDSEDKNQVIAQLRCVV